MCPHRRSRLLRSRRLFFEPLEERHVLAAAFAEFVDPNPTIGDGFGSQVVPLNTGNVVITAPFDDAAGKDAGAIYLFNGRTGALISTLTGATAGDHAGSGFVVALTNGNFVVPSPDWDKDPDDPDTGAATWGSGVTGVSGAISAANSLIGSSQGDFSGVLIGGLSNGNYVMSIRGWDHNNLQDVGAVTWGDGTKGVSGLISAANSLVGSVANDKVGGGGFLRLANGNYVVVSPGWNNGSATNAGAVTFASGTTGMTGAVSQSNSLVGTHTDDQVGSGNIIELRNGNYVVPSPMWDDTGVTDAGAATWGSGTSGVKGPVTSANSLVGNIAGDEISLGGRDGGVVALTNGNYVVVSPLRRARVNSSTLLDDAGAVTFGDGTTGVTGTINAVNSLLGSDAFDAVGSGGVAALVNGNYVVSSPAWSSNGVSNAGAVTWGSGTSGAKGFVNSSNSLVGTHGDDGDQQGVAALTNGNYVVSNCTWNDDAGAATWGDGTTGITGEINSTNSLVGTATGFLTGDQVGIGRITPLANGNYVVGSPAWDNGTVVDAGAVTWADGTKGIHGAISAANSIVGDSANDFVGHNSVTALANGNYVVVSDVWNNGSATGAGAVTFGDGAAGSIHGPVTAANSLVGMTAGDAIGSDSIFVLPNGNYIINSPTWDNPTGGGTIDVGAATFASGTSAMSGPISAANSLVGSTANDKVGTVPIALSSGNYVVISDSWRNATSARAATFGSGTSGVVGAITAQNSALGSASGASPILFRDDPINHDFYGAFGDEGRVLVGSLIDGFAHRWHLAATPPDVNNDGHVAADDVITIINYINAQKPTQVSPTADLGKPYGFLDVTGDDNVVAEDVITVINYINAHPGEAEGEAVGSGQSSIANGQGPGTNSQEEMDAVLMLLAMDAASQPKRRP